ncbi:MAG: four helix bundle protein [Flavobacterium sp.]|uniref:four helix bundle protein n=1 Tax=Flavobacterium sp. TaxID=239 RepID=UPI00273552EF|nr:four helix bundle protein [Flavobacterium sp.]MDP3680247.1 four helix bundle protein [Flavobacterium sp.]
MPSNIAEGSSRQSNKDFARFLEIAIGSAYEVETQILISSDLGFITPEDLIELSNMLNEIIKMTSRFRATLL